MIKNENLREWEIISTDLKTGSKEMDKLKADVLPQIEMVLGLVALEGIIAIHQKIGEFGLTMLTYAVINTPNGKWELHKTITLPGIEARYYVRLPCDEYKQVYGRRLLVSKHILDIEAAIPHFLALIATMFPPVMEHWQIYLDLAKRARSEQES